jgi:pseudouridylate synthase
MKRTYRRLVISEDVRLAFRERQAVVALESTVITHGMPYPDNLNTALALEECVRENGAIPATIAVIDGLVRVGLSQDELKSLSQKKNAYKLSRRDLPVALAAKKTGGTTVATTMMIAQEAGIRVFATGGIGGVHRGAESTFDVSADLEELGRTSVCVVSAGAKAVLDLPKTLEVLESKGVPVIGYGCDEFPAFYYRNSGLKTSARMDTPEEVAELLIHKWNLARWPDSMRFDGGVLVANPILQEDAMDREEIEAVITQAIGESQVSGRDVTPFLLSRIGQLTKGKSQLSNHALIQNNAVVAAQIATALVEKIRK